MDDNNNDDDDDESGGNDEIRLIHKYYKFQFDGYLKCVRLHNHLKPYYFHFI